MARICVLVCVFFSMSCFSSDNEIEWFVLNRPPWFMLEKSHRTGAVKGIGYGDKIMAIYQKKLNHYNHRTKSV
jgi:hypothetical protein